MGVPDFRMGLHLLGHGIVCSYSAVIFVFLHNILSLSLSLQLWNFSSEYMSCCIFLLLFLGWVHLLLVMCKIRKYIVWVCRFSGAIWKLEYIYILIQSGTTVAVFSSILHFFSFPVPPINPAIDCFSCLYGWIQYASFVEWWEEKKNTKLQSRICSCVLF